MAGGCIIAHLNGYKEISEDSYRPITNHIGPLLNPALAFGQIFFSWTWSWWHIYPCMPFIGSIIALVFYEFVFVKSQEYLNDSDGSDEDCLSLASDTDKINRDIQRNDSQEA